MSHIIEYFIKNCQNHPQRPAIKYYFNTERNFTISNYLLLSGSQKVLNNLRERAVISDQTVGVLLRSNLCLAAIIIGILRNGGSFICLDPETPEKNKAIMTKLNMQWLLHSDENVESDQIGNVRSTFLLYKQKIQLIEIANSSYETLKMNCDICYVVSTSGTTGTPKIVRVPRVCIMPNIEHFRSLFHITHADRVYFSTPITFDPYIIELFLCLMTNAVLTIISPELRTNKVDLAHVIFPRNGNGGVTFWQVPPSLLFSWNEDYIDNHILGPNSPLRILVLGGERFPDLQYVRKWKANHPKLRVFNVYGITEVSCWASVHEVLSAFDDDSAIPKRCDAPIGLPLKNTIFTVKNEAGESIVEGEGELYIGSETRVCYIDDEDPESLKKEKKIFRPSGDLVNRNPNTNTIMYISRKNLMIKKFGHRLSLEAIEKVAAKYTGRQSACIQTDDNILVLFILTPPETYKEAALRKLLQKNVADVAIVNEIKIINSLPITKHGKIDRARLLNAIKKKKTPFRTDGLFFQLCRKYLGLTPDVPEQFPTASFVGLGGSSILAMHVINEFEDLSQFEFPNEIYGQLLDADVALRVCCENIEKHFRQVEYSEKSKKKRKTIEGAEQLMLPWSTFRLDLEQKWRVDLEGCIDATPAVCYRNQTYDVVIGSHAKRLVAIEHATSERVFQMDFLDRIEGTACISSCQQYAFVGCHNGMVYALDLANQKLLWAYEAVKTVKATPTLSSNGDTIFVGSYDKNLHCITIATGKRMWIQPVGGSVTSQVLTLKPYVYVATTKGNCFCFSEVGELIWRKPVAGPIFGSPCVINQFNVQMIVWPDAKGLLHCLNCSTGSKVWEYKAQGAIYSSLVAINDKFIYFGCHDHGLYCLEVAPSSCSLKSRILFEAPIYATPCLFSYYQTTLCQVATIKGDLYILDEANKLVAAKKLPGEVFSSGVYCDHTIIIGCRDNYIYCINLVGKK